jgi:threonine aldolase
MNKRGFASDNNAGVHPLVLKTMMDCNQGHAIAYGGDEYTTEVENKIKNLFKQPVSVYFVFNGTAANVLSICALTKSYHAVICADTAHINVDECGAPEKFSSCKLLTVKTTDGKLTPELVSKHVHGFGVEHHVQPKLISISQSTELGTVYTPDEIINLSVYAHNNNMLLHMDGARISNAAAGLGLEFDDITGKAGVDILSLGGTKNGLMYGEAIVLFRPELADDLKFFRKQGMQLASKMRFIAAQFDAFLENELWKENASHANRMARLLYTKIKDIPGVKVTQKVEANGVFAQLPPEIIPELQKEYFFYVWDEEKSEVRWMTSFDTTEEDIENFAALLKKLCR